MLPSSTNEVCAEHIGFLAHPLVAAPDVEETLVVPRVDSELSPLVVHQEGLLRDGARVGAGAEEVDRLDLGQEVEVQALREKRGSRGRKREEMMRGRECGVRLSFGAWVVKDTLSEPPHAVTVSCPTFC